MNQSALEWDLPSPLWGAARPWDSRRPIWRAVDDLVASPIKQITRRVPTPESDGERGSATLSSSNWVATCENRPRDEAFLAKARSSAHKSKFRQKRIGEE